MREDRFRETSKRVRRHRQNYLPVLVAVVLIIIIASVRIAVNRWTKKRKEQEEIILHDNTNLTVDEKESDEINSVGKNPDDNSEDK